MSFNRDDNRSGGFRGGFGRGGGRGGFGGGRSSFHSDRGPREMFKTTCSNCGKECEVPFRPTNGKPVYCSDCFEKMGNGGRSDSRRPERNEFRAPGFDQKAQFDALNAKLEKIISLLEPKKVETVVPNPVVKEAKEVKEAKAPKAKKATKKPAPTKKE